MISANTRTRRFWTVEEDKKLIIGFNRHLEALNVYKSIEKDQTLNFSRSRSNIDIKDRLRVLSPCLKVIKSFFVPIDCRDPHEFVPEELWNILDTDIEQDSIELLPINQRIELNDILYEYTTQIDHFFNYYNFLAYEPDQNPMLNCKTWNQICDKSFKARNRLKAGQKMELLKKLVSNGYLKRYTVGNRIFVYRV